MAFASSSFPVVERAGFWVGSKAVVGGHVAGAQQAPVVSAWALQIAGDAAGVVRNRRESGDAGQSISVLKIRQVTVDADEELGAQQRPEAGHAFDGRSVGAWSRKRSVISASIVSISASRAMTC